MISAGGSQSVEHTYNTVPVEMSAGLPTHDVSLTITTNEFLGPLATVLLMATCVAVYYNPRQYLLRHSTVSLSTFSSISTTHGHATDVAMHYVPQSMLESYVVLTSAFPQKETQVTYPFYLPITARIWEFLGYRTLVILRRSQVYNSVV